jgi:hypothetical protein
MIDPFHKRWWRKASGTFTTISDNILLGAHEKDEANKWFGLHVDKSSSVTVSRLVETKLFSAIMEDSMHAGPESPSRQFPSLVSFVGETGVGKSTLSKCDTILIYDVLGFHPFLLHFPHGLLIYFNDSLS